MKKHPKQAFGILEDGKSLKLASLARDAYQISLLNLERCELDKPLYQAPEQVVNFEDNPWNQPDKGDQENKPDELNTDFVPGVKLNPADQILSSVELHKGVIALNVNEDQLLRFVPPPSNKKETRSVIKKNVSLRFFKKGEWQTSLVRIGSEVQLWLHRGTNQLLELLGIHGSRSRKRYYYQLADANDLALADYFRVTLLEDEQRVLLVYVGADYRKALLFDNGELVDIYPLSITHDVPDPDMIFKRVAFAMDTALQQEPLKYYLCGDHANLAVVDYFNQRTENSAFLFTHPLLVIDSIHFGAYDDVLLAQFTLPIALAFKALHPDEPRNTPSNFLPKRVIEAQRPFKFAWHGFLLMFAIFVVSVLGTVSYLNGLRDYSEAKSAKRHLDFQYTRLKMDAEEIGKMRKDIEQFGQNLEAVRTVLVGKNPWSQVLDTLNRLFQTKPVSWLTNLKQQNGKLMITGVTTNRSYVIDFANALPNSRIQKVTSGTIHKAPVWTFDIVSDFPTVDWVGQIEAEMQQVLELQQQEQQKLQEQTAAAEAQTPEEQAPEPAPATDKPKEPTAVATSEYPVLPPIAHWNMPKLTEEQSNLSGPAGTDYNAFARAVNNNDFAQVQSLGVSYLDEYKDGPMIPMVRWHLSHELYLRGKYSQAIEVLDPNVHVVDAFYPYSLLLAARISYTQQKQRYVRIYNTLLSEYPRHPVHAQVVADLAIINKGGTP